MTRSNLFGKGLVDALPVFAGYLSVGFTFGLAAAPAWHSAALPVAASMTHLSGTGQFVILSLLGAGSSLAAVMAGIIAINFRYVPMAMAVSQRLDPEMPLWQRLARRQRCARECK
ncbi:MAG: AzlC family ABC transporter permease [Kiritimatiellae bacterium]|nr:AzlC family ABC transporter permease [Kiritimatiellia bacterium]